jgi:hypothetical protein
VIRPSTLTDLYSGGELLRPTGIRRAPRAINADQHRQIQKEEFGLGVRASTFTGPLQKGGRLGASGVKNTFITRDLMQFAIL